MEEEFTKVAIDYLKTCENFVIDQAPDLIKQVISYKIMSHWLSVIVSIFFIMLLVGIFLYCYLNRKLDSYGNYTPDAFLWIFLPCIGSFMFFMIMVSSLDTLIKLYISPKMYLVEYFMKLSTGKN